MKTSTTFLRLFLALGAVLLHSQVFSQSANHILVSPASGLDKVNQFEESKDSLHHFNGVTIGLRGDFTLQFQSISHQTGSNDTLADLGSNFNLPTANLALDVHLAKGIKMNLSSYLSSRHHPETWIKGGHVQIDALEVIKPGFMSQVMDMVRFKLGLDEINYGDAHFRRSDNARTLYNPFVGNYIMDAFNTEIFGELYFQKKGFLLMTAISNGNLNQTVVKTDKEPKASWYGKLAYDQQLSKDLRLRISGSYYHSPGFDNGQYLYNGDRTGSRYYNIMQEYKERDNFRSGRFSPGFKKYTSLQLNPFIKWKGLSFFGVYEQVNGQVDETVSQGKYTQVAGEFIYRIGKDERYYLGTRYNRVFGKDTEEALHKSISRTNFGGGYFLSAHILLKAEYVKQVYTGSGWNNSIFQDGTFNGFMLEASISF